MPFLPAKLILLDHFKPGASLTDYHGPVKIVVAERDEMIPPKFGRRLYDSYSGPKEFQVIPGGHNDIAEQSADWWKEVLFFWMKNSTGTANIIQ